MSDMAIFHQLLLGNVFNIDWADPRFASKNPSLRGVGNPQLGAGNPLRPCDKASCAVVVVGNEGVRRIVRQRFGCGQNAYLQIAISCRSTVPVKTHVLPLTIRREVLSRSFITT